MAAAATSAAEPASARASRDSSASANNSPALLAERATVSRLSVIRGGDGRALAIQPLDQKIIVAGRWDANEGAGGELFVARLDTTGALDPTFGTAGVVLFTPPDVTQPQANGVALRSDGGIIVVGTATASGASVGFVVGLTSTGAIDPAYASAVVPNPLATGTNFRFNDVIGRASCRERVSSPV